MDHTSTRAGLTREIQSIHSFYLGRVQEGTLLVAAGGFPFGPLQGRPGSESRRKPNYFFIEKIEKIQLIIISLYREKGQIKNLLLFFGFFAEVLVELQLMMCLLLLLSFPKIAIFSISNGKC